MLGKIIGAVLVGVLAVGTAQAASFDCTKARTPFARAICATPALSKADETLAATFSHVLVSLSAPAKAEVQSAQNAWVDYANLACTKDARRARHPYDADGIACLQSVFEDRIAQLKQARVIGGLHFYYVDRYAAIRDPDPPDYGGTVGTKQVSTPRIDGTDAEATAFNRFIETQTVADINPAIATHPKPSDGSEDDQLTLLVTTVNPVRISMTNSVYSYGHGAAHPLSSTSFIHFLRGKGRRMVASDLFSAPGWQAKLQAIALAAVKKTEGDALMLDDPTSINDLVIDPARWDFSADGLILQFNPYEIAPYAAGAPQVTIPWADIKDLLAPGAAAFRS